MARQSITLANQNDEWLKQQVVNQEFTSKSEAVNYLITQARKREEYHPKMSIRTILGFEVYFCVP